MTKVLTAAQMRAIEAAAIESGDVTGLELMERAGQGAVEAILGFVSQRSDCGPDVTPVSCEASLQKPSPAAHDRQTGKPQLRAVVLCGPGNNGGDGFVVARRLREAGWDVAVYVYGDMDRLPPDAKVNYTRWLDLGEVHRISDPRLFRQTPDIWVDAIFGIGLTRDAPDDVYRALDYANSTQTAGCKSVALDMPSWFDSDQGRHLGRGHGAVFDLVVTFHAPKRGHYIGTAQDFIAELVVVDIGLDDIDAADAVNVIDETGLAGMLDKGAGHGRAHKYRHGHAVVLSGGVGKGGAARLAAGAALRVGAGVVTLACPPAALTENAAQLNAVMLRTIKDADAFTDVLSDVRINALCLGPGMGVTDASAAIVDTALKSGRALVLDADALTVVSERAALFAQLHALCVLTPHAGEFARLFPDIAAKLDAGACCKVDATRDAAARAGCVVLFKGPDTVIADPTGRCSLNASLYRRRAPWLATAGSGDVLAGLLTGLLARGFSPMLAAQTGAWLHTECALSFGPGLIAEDLSQQLPKVFRAMGL